jgi:hypothetical protein
MRYKVSVEFDLLEDLSTQDVDTISNCLEIVEELFKNIEMYANVKKRLCKNVDRVTIEHLSLSNHDSN